MTCSALIHSFTFVDAWAGLRDALVLASHTEVFDLIQALMVPLISRGIESFRKQAFLKQ